VEDEGKVIWTFPNLYGLCVVSKLDRKQ
jgi:hypothetical protein